MPAVAVGEDVVVVVDNHAAELVVVRDGRQTRVAVEGEVPFHVTAGPGEVLYGVSANPEPPYGRGWMRAYPLTGDRAGDLDVVILALDAKEVSGALPAR